ncbi:hypothetical protein KIL84_020934 [Mauremys mutica]|uniref:Uncharacterized protein n=1 Tax=Mauremys mutica TaxID=74926 RepID=A0A9D3XBJ5_9SAUR|nr:hypothetical protein KIL84_020934 [Mauremys mutica]
MWRGNKRIGPGAPTDNNGDLPRSRFPSHRAECRALDTWAELDAGCQNPPQSPINTQALEIKKAAGGRKYPQLGAEETGDREPGLHCGMGPSGDTGGGLESERQRAGSTGLCDSLPAQAPLVTRRNVPNRVSAWCSAVIETGALCPSDLSPGRAGRAEPRLLGAGLEHTGQIGLWDGASAAGIGVSALKSMGAVGSGPIDSQGATASLHQLGSGLTGVTPL